MEKRKGKGLLTIWLLMLMLIVGMCITTEAASKKETYKKAVKYIKARQYNKAQKNFDKLPDGANEACIKKMSSKMKKAYRNVVKKYAGNKASSFKPTLWGYYLTDINKDKKPELILKYGTCEADVKAIVYSYSKGKAKKVGSFKCGHSSFYYYPLGNGFVMQESIQSYEEISIVKMVNGKLKSTILKKFAMTKKYMSISYKLKDHTSWGANHKWLLDYRPLS